MNTLNTVCPSQDLYIPQSYEVSDLEVTEIDYNDYPVYIDPLDLDFED